MGQWWMLANLDKRENFGTWGKLGEFFYDDFETLIEFILTPFPHPAPDSALAKHKPYVRTMETGKALGRLDLPGEILHFIFDNITSFQDALFLTLATPLLEPFGHQRMYELICLCQQRWKGDRIICLGDYARTDDLPEGLLSETELQELQDQDKQLFYGFISETYQRVEHEPKAYWSPPYDVWSCLPKRELKFYMSISNEEPNCDRFEVTTLDRLSPPLASGGWRDISEPVVARLVANWEWE
ncbi:predicted protein [Postia placenta Mad-698-R]|nr:predicted protein [Postia placenta Mad-698-R]